MAIHGYGPPLAMRLVDRAYDMAASLRFYADILSYTLLVALLDGLAFLRSLFQTSQSLNSVNIAVDTTPTFFRTFWDHMLLRKKRKGTAAQQLSYAQGLALVKEFLEFSATHTVEELQSFTGKETPTPTWVHKSNAEIPSESLEAAAHLLRKHLEADDPGLKDTGGAKWWTLRARPLYGEWIEMMRDARKRENTLASGKKPNERVILYLHGGAHYFAGNGTHRYQIQRHARKLQARAFSVSFRLSPQYPFPCSLHDALAAYLYLIAPPKGCPQEAISPSNIVVYGDSSGGGLALALQVLLRDGKLPLPAGSVLLSPWVDLTHSFPSVMGDGAGDYIPPHGFHYKPSLAWPPVRGDSMVFKKNNRQLVVKEQIQLYCANSMVAHPMVTLINQGSLGGLPPMLVLGGSDELLADEIIYLAHKAANPEKYPPAEATLKAYPRQREQITRYGPTKVHLQMFDSCCHVTTTLSFTEPAKYQYRSAANFSLWALKAAEVQQNKRAEEAFNELNKDQRHHDYATGNGHDAPPPPQDRVANAEWKFPDAKHALASPEPIDPNEEKNGYLDGGGNGQIDGKGFNGTADTNGSHSKDYEESVLTDSDASLANKENEDLSDYSENSESSEEDEDTTIEKKRGDAGGVVAVEDSLVDELCDADAAKQAYISVTGTEPPFENSIIRQRVTPCGRMREMEPEDEIPALTMPRDEVGVISPEGPIKRWLEKRREWDRRYKRELIHWRKIKLKDRRRAAKGGYLSRELADENPPLSAVAGMWDKQLAWCAVKGQDSSAGIDGQREHAGIGLLLWSGLSSKPDAEQQGKKAIDELAKNGEMKLERKPSSVYSPDIEKEMSFDQ